MVAMLAMAMYLAQGPCEAEAALFQRGEMAEARRRLDGMRLDGAHCLKLSGIVYAAMGDYRRAVGPFEKACSLDSREPDACYYWARALYANDRYEESLAAIDRAAAQATAEWKLNTARGQCLDALGRPAAERVLRQAMEQKLSLAGKVSEPDPLLALAAYLNRQGRKQEVLKLLLGAPQSYQSIAVYHYQLGRVLSQEQRWEEAVDALAGAVGLDPHHAEAHGLLSRAYYRLGNERLGAEHARQATGRP